jgi:hypothetical protein
MYNQFFQQNSDRLKSVTYIFISLFLYNEFQAIPKEKKQENVGTYFLKFIEKTK